MKKFVLCIQSLCLIFAMSGVSFASSTAETFGFSPTGIAMGNAMVSIAHDWSSPFYNMAGLGRTTYRQKVGEAEAGDKTMALKRRFKVAGAEPAQEKEKNYPTEVAIGYMYNYPMLQVDMKPASAIDRRDVDAEKDLDNGVITIALALDINDLYQLPEKIVSSARLGIALMTNHDLSVAQVNDIDQRTHNFTLYGRESNRLSGFVGLGFGFLKDMFGVGIGVNASFAGKGKVLLDEVAVTSDKQVPEQQTRMDLSLSPYAVCGLYFDFGRAVGILNGWSIGAQYRQESKLDIDPFATGTVVLGTGTLQLDLAIFDYYSPHAVTVGTSYTRWNVTLAFDVEFQMWSMYEISRTHEIIYESQIGLQFPEFDDILIYRVGVSYDVLEWLTVMVGYYYQPTFIPDEATETIYNLMDNNKHVASLGFTFTLGPVIAGMQGPLELSLAYQFQYLEEREVTKKHYLVEQYWSAGYEYDNSVDPNATDPKSQNPGYSYGGMAHSVSVALTFKL